ncbi:hypothetical protein PIIN_10877 [Serendipita indica DSM 11827]|uniref:Uncharacterized protein n=1 Tax=Serendipita indica (strain DSM 11827) TaxID=1109443 RepID=G4TZZ8_SERID|nr:hypothetical protein PIIN_10877 [Serendipita indica DSM 11827]
MEEKKKKKPDIKTTKNKSITTPDPLETTQDGMSEVQHERRPNMFPGSHDINQNIEKDISTGGEHEGTGNQDNNSLLKQTEIHERKKERFSHRITIGQRLASEDRQLERIDASAAINDGSENDEGDGDIESGEELGRSNSLIPPYIRTKDKTPQSQEAVQGYPYAMFHLQR